MPTTVYDFSNSTDWSSTAQLAVADNHDPGLITGGQFAPSVDADGGFSGLYVTTQTVTGDYDLTITIAQVQTGGRGTWIIWSTNSGLSTVNAYHLFVNWSGNTSWLIEKWVNGAFNSTLRSATGPNAASGDKIRFVRVGNILRMYHQVSGSGTWTQIGTDVTDGTPLTGAGHVGISAQKSTSPFRLDDFTVTVSNAPSLVGEGAIANVTTGNLTVTLPSHQADDILILCAEVWTPATTGDVVALAVSTAGWTQITETGTPATTPIDGRIGMWWRRAASGAETNPIVTRPAGSSTGTATSFAGRAYAIRGCWTGGVPWDQASISSLYSTANQNMPAVNVTSGLGDRLVVQFLTSQDDQAAGAAPSGYTAGTAATSATGTDAGFQSYRQVTTSNVAAIASATAAPVQGRYLYAGLSFRPDSGAVSSTTVKTMGLLGVG